MDPTGENKSGTTPESLTFRGVPVIEVMSQGSLLGLVDTFGCEWQGWIIEVETMFWGTLDANGYTATPDGYRAHARLPEATLTGSPAEFVPWQGHDFSMRGMSGLHDAVKSGAGHLLSFTGTDTIAAIDYLEDYYGAADDFVGGSVPASEHSVMCMGGDDAEIETFRRLIQDLYPSGVVSIVSDTWDFWRVITEYAVILKDIILARQPNAIGLAKVVFRPDSGDPIKILCGDPEAPVDSPARKGAVQCLWDVFGGTLTSTGHKLLNQRVGLIYGDAITLDRAQEILRRLAEMGFASANVVFGIGSYTYQHVTRDTFGNAYKCTWGVVNGVPRELFKDPITDGGSKKSAKGLLRVEKIRDNFMLFDQQLSAYSPTNVLRRVFQDGKAHNVETLATIRARLLSEGR